MNKDLMMKAAVQFKGVWPDDGYGLIIARPSDIILGNKERDGSVSYVSKGVTENTFLRSWSHCTREQFEDFVESLFDGAPEGATHYSPEDEINHQSWWNLAGDQMRCICEECDIYTWELGHFDGTFGLIPRPVKKAEPKSPYMPKVGEECEAVDYDCGNDSYYQRVIFIGDNPRDLSKGSYKVFSCVSGGDLFWSDKFRPLRTERELFIEQATKDYLDQVGSDAVNSKWFERIFGAMHDAGYTKGGAK